MSQPPIALDRYIQLSSNASLDLTDVKAWFKCVQENAPSGVITTVTIRDNSGSPRSVALVHSESETRHHYRVPLSRALSNKEVGAIAKCFAKLTDFDFDVDTNETSLSARDHTGISLDAAKHLALCTALAKQNHEDWLRERTDAGWRYGMEFDAEEKTHPLIRPWDQLPDRYKKPDMSWPQKLITMLDDQGYAVIQKDDLDRLLSNLRIVSEAASSYTPPVLDIGDRVLVGKFKNRKAEIVGFKKDDHQQPVLKTTKGDQKLFKPRIPKLYEISRPKPSQEHLQDAIEHADYNRDGWTLKDFSLKYEGYLSVEDLYDFDDLSGWLEVESPEDLSNFRHGGFEGGPKEMPPIVVITAPDEDGCRTQIGDGRGRVNFANAHNLKLHVWHLTHKSCV